MIFLKLKEVIKLSANIGILFAFKILKNKPHHQAQGLIAVEQEKIALLILNADAHPICGLLFKGGPAALVTEYNLQPASHYADACHLCYEARTMLRERFPQYLNPDQMYGVFK